MKRLARQQIASRAVLLALAAVVCLCVCAEPRNNFRFAILGDRTGGAQHGVYEQVWREVSLLRPDFVINVGDTIEGGKDATAAAEWESLRKLWNRYNLPQYFTPGNHDIWSADSRRVYEKETGRPASYGFNYQDAHFTVLDNSGSLNLSDAQMRFLADDLEKNKGRSPKFVLFHQPFWLIPLKFGSGEFPFHELVRKYGVNYVLSGHGHQFVRLERDGIVYIEAGSSGAKLKGEGFERGWFYLHILATVRGAKVEMEVKELDEPMGKGRRFNAEDWEGKRVAN